MDVGTFVRKTELLFRSIGSRDWDRQGEGVFQATERDEDEESNWFLASRVSVRLPYFHGRSQTAWC